jgi:TatD DNase family protein
MLCGSNYKIRTAIRAEIVSTTTSKLVKQSSYCPRVCSSMSQHRFADVGINLTDDTFRGLYYGKQHHEDDVLYALQRAVDVGCVKFMVTGSDLEESKKAIQLAEKHPGQCYATVGVHPCSAKAFDKYPGGPSQLLRELEQLAIHGKKLGLVTAFGEIGLDYDRLMLTEKTQQLQYFEAQPDLAVKIQLPLFLHSRAAHEDFERLLKSRLPQLPKRGLVHSFTGTLEELNRLLALDLDIGINGCSMKTEENLEVVKAVPLERLQLETDGPWVCVFRRTAREDIKPLLSIQHCF